ncbi:MAG: NAD(+) diphosphatase [Azovibrio sp.]
MIFAFIGDTLLLGQDRQLPAPEALEASGMCREILIFGSLNGVSCELHFWSSNTPVPSGLEKGDYRQLWGYWDQGQMDALCRSQQLAAWLHQHQFCGLCGYALKTSAHEPARECPSCGFKVYPKISPVCIGLVLKGEKLLLARSPHFPPGMYSALAGFVEVGESAEACLRREIREEAGIEIGNIRWFGSQAWPYPHTLMMGFIADYVSGELVAQEDEIEDIGWFEKEALPQLPHPSSIAFQMIDFVCREEKNGR